MLPNILITGTPGTGKTTTADLLAELSGLRHINVSQLIGAQGLHDGRDEQYDCWIMNDDKLCDALEPIVSQGGCIVEFHCSDVFPERWFQLVLVLRADNTILYNRLEARGYSVMKLRENVECEIMRVILDETLAAYDSNIVHELPSNSVEEMEQNVKRIMEWLKAQQQGA